MKPLSLSFLTRACLVAVTKIAPINFWPFLLSRCSSAIVEGTCGKLGEGSSIMNPSDLL